MKKLNVLGVMSGSSMDGVDLALCEIQEENGNFSFKMLQTATYDYDEKWRLRLSKLRTQNALTYVKTDIFYAHFLAELINDFITTNNLKVDLVASHGHTIFHNPEVKTTAQIGDGATLAAKTKLPVITDFRRADVALNGEGAPLVAIGDKLLFGEYDFCLNLGGFANISANTNGKNIAFDICACNILTNRLARDIEQPYDNNGEIAEKGKIDYDMLNELNELEFYQQEGPKSLNRDWISDALWPIVKEFRELPLEDRMKTVVDHIAFQIGKAIEKLSDGNSDGKRLFITGGGAFNTTLIDHIKSHTEAEIIIPENDMVNYKEALIFALLGFLRVQNKANTIATATGASEDVIGGAMSGNYSQCI